jgi:hypothetical protein
MRPTHPCVKGAKYFSSAAKFGIMPGTDSVVENLVRMKQELTVDGLLKTGECNGLPEVALSGGRLYRRLLLSSLLLSLAFFCGCQTSTQSLFIANGPGWHIQQGQALWRPKSSAPEFGGDLVLARDDAGRCVIQFDKTPMAILFVQTTTNRWLIRFPQRDLGFSGRGEGWTRFAWLYLPAALDGRPLPKDFEFDRKPDGGWRLENSSTGETVEGYLSP